MAATLLSAEQRHFTGTANCGMSEARMAHSGFGLGDKRHFGKRVGR
jgi:hypothetical protein